MFCVHTHPVKIRFVAPFFSSATLFVFLAHVSVIIFGFLIAYFSHGLWLKESFYREQPIVSYRDQYFLKLMGTNSTSGKPFELKYSSFEQINLINNDVLRYPDIRVRHEDINGDGITDQFLLSATFPVVEEEQVQRVEGIFMFSYMLRNRVRLNVEAPVLLSHTGGVAGRELFVSGSLSLSLANALPVLPSVRTTRDPLFPTNRTLSSSEVTMTSLVDKVAARNDTFLLEPAVSTWNVAMVGCNPKCNFVIRLKVKIPNQKVWYVPTFIEVAKFSWIQILATWVFLYFFVLPFIHFILDHQIIQSVVKHPLKKFHRD
ncbi:hypothetical protein GUITHDRAFT_108424 [Guillardia theta CCMP2712]|uniref:Transmembrane protein 231 n=2 Tax=Guillardia theta TaxID=55529 RepID=L1JBT2_GUITC|nr:hypothetical protein GUITHDRAFT_108424 [Guillardia theta CCMP2712]EKX45550.1 hypothetical protein GUITHDRAFT_108424 [Guillardia theta CCMP2712]|mmetsp:Transcript_19479/g.64515  ORF Transcript_19479/g.64515 Transcript_19479/m.64515 type:complete len:317 (+) Transcript_19479:92-1042(+)|eukprot:XP_005832530.1 hypothetical protein GUITHDRAFT_108424 [Guillardia theta CCMP2712]